MLLHHPRRPSPPQRFPPEQPHPNATHATPNLSTNLNGRLSARMSRRHRPYSSSSPSQPRRSPLNRRLLSHLVPRQIAPARAGSTWVVTSRELSSSDETRRSRRAGPSHHPGHRDWTARAGSRPVGPPEPPLGTCHAARSLRVIAAVAGHLGPTAAVACPRSVRGLDTPRNEQTRATSRPRAWTGKRTTNSHDQDHRPRLRQARHGS